MTAGDIIRQLLRLEPGWATVAEVTCTLYPDDANARSTSRRLIGELARAGSIESLYVRHQRSPMLCVRLDPLALTALVDSHE